MKDLQQDLQILREKITHEQRIAKELQEERERNIERNKLKSNQNLTLRKMVEEIDILLKELINVVKIWTCQRALIENQSTITPLAEELLHRRKVLRVAIKELLQVTPSKKQSKCLLQGWLLQNLTEPFAKKPLETSSVTSSHITEKSEKNSKSFFSEDPLLSRNFSLRRWASDSQLGKLTCRNTIH
ncbi:uncharacterized protein LOC118187826 [Stegodyphus dumicola]|uniref:uncharacterized protein LOC118187826 n=1 Tax=Stegodyphus dumicola TaxID=202533 RepID=UPI0015B07321|nr:uncharacterized protein LOC118187826 [Stegodyphus dumicola]XP_035213998.1 uncharacterized protein LOC118187826 [Stegodyphus dumicola]